MNLTRRQMLGWGTLLASGAAVSFAALSRRTRVPPTAARWGPVRSEKGALLGLPEGFEAHLLQTAGDRMSDGRPARGAPDGMACFPTAQADRVIVMRNHELTSNGGVSRMVVGLRQDEAPQLLASNDVLEGTLRNCAGGPSPWGWLSCEEVSGGGVWVCPQDTTSLLRGPQRRRIDAYGFFRHEAVAIDPRHLTAYLTEDDGMSHVYRMVPDDPQAPWEGRLQALRHASLASFETDSLQPGGSFRATWVDVRPETAPTDAKEGGAAVFVRGEGLWWFDDRAVFTCTTHDQVFEYVPDEPPSNPSAAKNSAAGGGGTVRLLAQGGVQGPDNVTVAPWGDLFVAEDNRQDNSIRVVHPDGLVSEFCRNLVEPSSEFTGVCFSPNGRVLFCNIQGPGLTFAITGPFPTTAS